METLVFRCGECDNQENPCIFEGDDLSGSVICPLHKDYTAKWYTLEDITTQLVIEADAKRGCPSCPVPPLAYPIAYCPYCGTKIRTA